MYISIIELVGLGVVIAAVCIVYEGVRAKFGKAKPKYGDVINSPIAGNLARLKDLNTK